VGVLLEQSLTCSSLPALSCIRNTILKSLFREKRRDRDYCNWEVDIHSEGGTDTHRERERERERAIARDKDQEGALKGRPNKGHKHGIAALVRWCRHSSGENSS
jgi:hypothetical protein